MSISDVTICNLALSHIGEGPIRTLDEIGEKAVLCKRFYAVTRDYHLTMYDWSFARRTSKLQEIDEDHAKGIPFQMPSGCLSPRFLYPRVKSKRTYYIEQDRIIIPEVWVISGVDLHLCFTFKEVNTALFTSTFSDLIALSLSSKLAGPLTSDYKLAASLRKEARLARIEAETEDANRDSEYIAHDDHPYNDTFINPDGLGAGYPDHTDE